MILAAIDLQHSWKVRDVTRVLHLPTLLETGDEVMAQRVLVIVTMQARQVVDVTPYDHQLVSFAGGGGDGTETAEDAGI